MTSLGHLRADLKKAQNRVIIVGPWIDAFFAGVVVGAIPAKVDLRVVTRPPDSSSSSFAPHAVAARATFDARTNTSVRLLATLHAKVVTIDDLIVYCGSANWYRYSLEESREIVLRSPVADVPGVLDEVQVIWDQGAHEPAQSAPAKPPMAVEGYREEVLDPVAAAKLRVVPGSFVISAPKKK